MLKKFIQQHSLSEDFTVTANQYFIPLAHKLSLTCVQRKSAQQTMPFFVGINGCQGSGKSTLVEFLALYLKDKFNLTVVSLSLDDFYLNQATRQLLAATIHPLFKFRGVPATHNIKLLKHTLQQLKEMNNPNNTKASIQLPRFDKARDNPKHMQYCPMITPNVDIVLFEGWCWGVPVQAFQALKVAVNELENKQDPSGLWRKYVNQALQHEYQPLYKLMDMWLMLKAPSFDVVYQWRLQQEQKLAKANTDKNSPDSIMNEQELFTFIQLFQRLTEQSLIKLPNKVDILFELNEKRKIVDCRGLI